jgi:hypothetical protein
LRYGRDILIFISQILKYIKIMKKIFIAILMTIASISFANAQTAKKSTQKKTTTASTATTNAVTSKSTKVEKTGTHLKKDGTADKRFKENKTKTVAAGPMKKNGTPDMRYKANKKK